MSEIDRQETFRNFCDLHSHSNCSDGAETPQALAAAAREAGVRVLALTDHNRLDTSLADELSRTCGLQVIPACEFSSMLPAKEGYREIHIIGLWLEETEEIRSLLQKNQPDRRKYVMDHLLALQSLGVDLSPEQDRDAVKAYAALAAENGSSSYLGRAAIAKRMVKMGYAASTAEAFSQWLGRDPGDRQPFSIRAEDYLHYAPPEEVIRAIHSSPGALAVLCHPYYHTPGEDVESLVRLMAALEADAMEVFYGTGGRAYSWERRARLLGLARRYGLAPSAGSDRHGPEQPFLRGAPEILRGLLERRHRRLRQAR